jgi:hypothetical protein
MGWFQKLVYGVDLEEEQRRQDDLDRQLRDLNERDYGPGGRIYNRIEADRGTAAADDTFQQVLANLDASDDIDVEAEVNDAFRQGLEEGAGNIRSGFNFTFGAIPWQVWAIAAVAAFLYAGGGDWLKNHLKK